VADIIEELALGLVGDYGLIASVLELVFGISTYRDFVLQRLGKVTESIGTDLGAHQLAGQQSC